MAVHVNADALAMGIHPITSGSIKYNDQMKTQALKQALNIYKFDAALGGARRDEEKSRAKERIFSVLGECCGARRFDAAAAFVSGLLCIAGLQKWEGARICRANLSPGSRGY